MPRSNTDELNLLIQKLGRSALKAILAGAPADAPVKRRKRRKNKKTIDKKEAK